MGYRSDLDAAHARAEALQGRVAQLEAENAALRGRAEDSPPAPVPAGEIRRSMRYAVAAIAVLGLVASAGLFAISGELAAAMAVVAAVTVATPLIVVAQLVEVCPPGFVLVLTGGAHLRKDGSARGYRIVRAGRAVRMPFLERAELLDARARPVSCSVRAAYCRGSTPVDAQVDAIIRANAHEPLVHNAIERFLGQEPSAIERVAREVLEGNLRAVIAELGLEELQQDPDRVGVALASACDADMNKLGLCVDAVHLERVSVHV